MVNKPKRLWKYSGRVHKVLMCWDCSLSYHDNGWVEYNLKHSIWELINPSCDYGGGMLCLLCAMRRLKFLGLEDTPIWLGAFSPTDHLSMASHNRSDELDRDSV